MKLIYYIGEKRFEVEGVTAYLVGCEEEWIFANCVEMNGGMNTAQDFHADVMKNDD